MLDLDIAVLGPAERLETLAKCNDPSQHFGIILGVWMQECDAPHALALLRAPGKRPRRQAWLRIFVVRCSLPCDPPVGGHSCNAGIIPRFHRAVSD